MIRRRSVILFTSFIALSGGGGGGVAAQALSVDVAVDQSFTSLDPLPSPFGFAISTGGIRLWGPFGVQASFRSVSDPGGTVDQRCGVSTCVDGLFERSNHMRTVGFGLTFDFVNPVDVWLTLVLSGTANWQSERFRHIQTGEQATLESSGADLGLASAAYLRLRPLVLGLRPEVSLHFDRIFAGACAADAPCWPSRNVFGLSAGLGWVWGSE